MPRDQRWSDPDWDADSEWDDDETDDDFGPDDPSTTTDCIQCGCEIYDDAVQCPLCGEYQIGDRSRSAWDGRPLWWKLGGVLGIIAMLIGLLVFCF